MNSIEMQAVETHVASLRRTRSGDIDHGFYERRGRAIQGRAVHDLLARAGSRLIRHACDLVARFR